MRTSAKRRELERADELRLELLALESLDELALYGAREELDRYYAELLSDAEAELEPAPWWDVLR